MLTEPEKRTLHDSWKLASPISETIADLFYRRLFELRPDYRSLFPTDMGPLKKKLISMLDFIVQSTQWSADEWQVNVSQDSDLFLVVLALGRRHQALYQVPIEGYAVVREALLWTLDYGLGEAFTDEVRATWKKTYQLISSIMLMGSKNQLTAT